MDISKIDTNRLRSDLCNQFNIEPIEHGLQVNTGVLFLSGDCVQVSVYPDPNGFLVSDHCSAAMYLESHGLTIGAKLRHSFSGYAQKYDCAFISNRVQKTCTTDQVPIAITLVANASKSIADYIIDFRRKHEASFKRKVSEQLEEIVGNRMRKREPVTGQSGLVWHVDNVVLDQDLKHPIAFIETVPNRNAVPRRFATFLDLKGKYEGVSTTAIIKDVNDLRLEDRLLLKRCCDPVEFEKSKSAFKKLAEAA